MPQRNFHTNHEVLGAFDADEVRARAKYSLSRLRADLGKVHSVLGGNSLSYRDGDEALLSWARNTANVILADYESLRSHHVALTPEEIAVEREMLQLCNTIDAYRTPIAQFDDAVHTVRRIWANKKAADDLAAQDIRNRIGEVVELEK